MAGGTEHQVQQAMDEEALRELPKVEKRTGYLAMLGNLATLAGLLGTITGLIKSFASVAGVDPSMKATMLSKGIAEAMNCTAFGLFTGILGLATFAWLNGTTQEVLDGVNQASVETLNLVIAGQQPSHQQGGGHY
jgi:biopolymer transport protein ExbB/TolQ